MANTSVRKKLPKCFWYQPHCSYEDSKGLCTKKGNCGFKERQKAMKERLGIK